ncbi:polyadenylate-binding protein RBP45C-like [Vigna umbellata]|uniref:polyadenylate-binding protein RBP45C-like n=1 Tax=Vigna umbellata TaxID=87088 RepID=UPI001F5E5668|nr:polyadenylate-binding protein RBP45C-like [Vigna umbellata]XP_047161428.1 polyadenylate-binding protein RBP45C-like [Vigna umbellata]XP_047174502.1 polyadenylate-binding protein RBP45C-like [Vigna umbellata]XP_047174585.1 polyadenylate-binding protein RBP45C-like [Vigna umbellata]XP_047176683.1 polyadenylate-binding protein RBP45C-like [Vigna umbellata]
MGTLPTVLRHRMPITPRRRPVGILTMRLRRATVRHSRATVVRHLRVGTVIMRLRKRRRMGRGAQTDDHLRQVFGQYGELVHVKIPAGKRCGFVQFADRSCAEEALRVLNGTLLGGQNVRLSWGRSPSNKQAQPDANQWNGIKKITEAI